MVLNPMPTPRYWEWLLEDQQFLFQPSSSPHSPPLELCSDIVFEIFLCLPLDVLPRFTCPNKQYCAIITNPLFQRTYWTQKLCLPRLYVMVYYQHRLTSRIGFALAMKEYDERLDKIELHKYRLVPRFSFPSSSYIRLLRWTYTMLQYNRLRHIVSEIKI